MLFWRMVKWEQSMERMQPTIFTTDYRRERRQRADAIIEKLKAHLSAAVAHFPVALVYLHGSVARGCPLPTSDVDLALVLNESLPKANDRLKLEFQIQAVVEAACGVKNVDARVINQAPVLAQGEILREGICLYARDPAQRAEFESLVRRKYFDYLPAAQRMQRAFLHRVRQKGLKRGQA
jgi:predicted nucleotidyltransferase